MKTTIEISDALLARAKRRAHKLGKPLRALVEDGLRLVLESDATHSRYRLPDFSVGSAEASNPLEALTWDDLRAEIYAGL
ncbi:MAG: type II toxin-antitoxin system VapB family antitoxin [Deltaproteobacteria bacterium]|nr:type II toxin-antitoxin system VapB family antitoxin [Deltaproteobacteria bacterium]